MEELEAAIWAAMRAHQVTAPAPGEFVDAVTRLALAWAAGDSEEITRYRRQVLHRETA